MGPTPTCTTITTIARLASRSPRITAYPERADSRSAVTAKTCSSLMVLSAAVLRRTAADSSEYSHQELEVPCQTRLPAFSPMLHLCSYPMCSYRGVNRKRRFARSASDWRKTSSENCWPCTYSCDITSSLRSTRARSQSICDLSLNSSGLQAILFPADGSTRSKACVLPWVKRLGSSAQLPGLGTSETTRSNRTLKSGKKSPRFTLHTSLGGSRRGVSTPQIGQLRSCGPSNSMLGWRSVRRVHSPGSRFHDLSGLDKLDHRRRIDSRAGFRYGRGRPTQSAEYRD